MDEFERYGYMFNPFEIIMTKAGGQQDKNGTDPLSARLQ